MKRLGIVFLVVLSLAALFVFGLSPRISRDVASAYIDRTLPDFEAPLFERYQARYGETLRYSDYLGDPIVVNIWASWCKPACWNEAPRLQAAWEKYGGQVMMIGVDFQDKDDNAKAFLDTFGLTFPSVKDPNSKIGIDWGVFGVPETYSINADGTLNYKHAGELSSEILETQIEALLE